MTLSNNPNVIVHNPSEIANDAGETFILASRDDVGILYDGLNNFLSLLTNEEKNTFSELIFSNEEKFSVRELLNIPVEQILNKSEQLILNEVQTVPVSQAQSQSRSMVVVLKATRLCNLRCTYCHAWREGPGHVMSFAVLLRTIRDALCAPGVRYVDFVWHGGEATLLGTKFLRKALWLQQKFVPDDVTFANAIQTNAVNISNEMLLFFKKYNFSVGVSIDGPPIVNDMRRIDKNGKGTSERIIKTLNRLNNMHISYGLLVVVDQEIASLPPEYLLDYFVSTGSSSIDILNALPENADDSCAVIGSYIPYPEYVEYMCRLYVVWSKSYKNKIDIRTFTALIDLLSNRSNGLCIFAGSCQGNYITIESTGDISACDKYVGDNNYNYGNLFSGNLNEVLHKSENLKKARQELISYKSESKPCPWYSICNGGCPHDRKISKKYVSDASTCCGLGPLLKLISAENSVPITI